MSDYETAKSAKSVEEDANRSLRIIRRALHLQVFKGYSPAQAMMQAESEEDHG